MPSRIVTIERKKIPHSWAKFLNPSRVGGKSDGVKLVWIESVLCEFLTN